MFRASSVPTTRSYQLYTWQLVRFMQVTWPLPRRVRFQPDPPRKRPHNLHKTYQLPSVQLITPDDGDRRCPKHVVSWQNKFWILDVSSWLFYTTQAHSLLPLFTSVPPCWDVTWHQLPSCLTRTWPSTTSAGYCQRTKLNVLSLPPKKSPISFKLCTICSSVRWVPVPYTHQTTDKSTMVEPSINRGYRIQIIT